MKKPVLRAEPSDDRPPRNPPARTMPSTGFGLEVDGRMKNEYESQDQAETVARALKQRFPNLRITIYNAEEKTRALIE